MSIEGGEGRPLLHLRAGVGVLEEVVEVKVVVVVVVEGGVMVVVLGGDLGVVVVAVRAGQQHCWASGGVVPPQVSILIQSSHCPH